MILFEWEMDDDAVHSTSGLYQITSEHQNTTKNQKLDKIYSCSIPQGLEKKTESVFANTSLEYHYRFLKDKALTDRIINGNFLALHINSPSVNACQNTF